MLFCRSEQPLEDATRRKLSVSCQVASESIISLHDTSNIYRVPLLLAEQRVGVLACRHFHLDKESAVLSVIRLNSAVQGTLTEEARHARLGDWRLLADRVDTCSHEVAVAVVGKYTGLHDSYLSVIKALKHAAIECGYHLTIEWVDSADLEPNAQLSDPKRHDAAWWRLKNAQGVLLPGGFGDRVIDGKVRAANYCRTSNTPFLGICGGMQMAVIEFARSMLGWESANSTEFDESTPHPVVVFFPEASATVMGGTMRLGSRATVIKDQDSVAFKLYGGRNVIHERRRHRYEVNGACVPAFVDAGLKFPAQDDRGHRMDICELPGHPFYFGCQFHPEFQSRPAQPAPMILGFVLACVRQLERRMEDDGGVLRCGSGFERSW